MCQQFRNFFSHDVTIMAKVMTDKINLKRFHDIFIKVKSISRLEMRINMMQSYKNKCHIATLYTCYITYCYGSFIYDFYVVSARMLFYSGQVCEGSRFPPDRQGEHPSWAPGHNHAHVKNYGYNRKNKRVLSTFQVITGKSCSFCLLSRLYSVIFAENLV